MRKLNYRVVFPFELRLRNTSDDCNGADDFYDLFAVVVHVGQGPNHGELFYHCHLYVRAIGIDGDQSRL